MVAAGLRIDSRRAAEFAKAHHQHPVGQSAVVDILGQRRHGAIEFGQQFVFELGEVVAVRVPAAAGLNLHERDAGLDEPPGQQAALAQVVAAVVVAQPSIFGSDVKGLRAPWGW